MSMMQYNPENVGFLYTVVSILCDVLVIKTSKKGKNIQKLPKHHTESKRQYIKRQHFQEGLRLLGADV